MVERLRRGRRRGGSGRRFRLAVVLIIVAFIISISTIVAFYTDLLWFQEVGFTQVFWTVWRSQALLALGFGILFFLFSMLNLLLVARIMPAYRMSPDPSDPLERYRGAFLPYYRWIALGVSGFLGLIFALSVTPYWERIVLAFNSVPFGAKDAVFGRDLSFYVFRLPFYQFLYGWFFTALIVVAITVVVAHYLSGGIRPQSPGDRVTPQVKAHVSALLGLIALLRAWGYRLDQFNLLYSERGDITGASYTDIHAERPALTLLIVISVIVAVLFLVNIRRRGWALPLAGVGLWLLISILALGAFPFVIQRFTVEPSQLQKEQPFIERNIKATRLAYGIDLEPTDIKEYDAITGITREAVESNAPTISNIRLWDPETLAKGLRQLQEIRTYYQFADVDVDRYTLDGRLRQVMLSARELATQNIETTTWQNLHVVFTHGYGAVVSPSNEASPEGGPTFLLQNVPPVAASAPLELTKPGVYFGEGMSDYSLVKTRQQELDFGTEAGNQFTTYDGKGGVRVTGLTRRLAFAWRFRHVNIAISGLIEDDTRVIYYRTILERLRKAAPFLHFDGDPYPVISNGRLVWMADAYTVTNMYPYSERIELGDRTVRSGIQGEIIGPTIQGMNNYIRNSVKATVDAYDGTLNFYVWDPKDPIIKAWTRVFPDLLRDVSEMPEDLRSHVRYPEDLFRIQTNLYLRWHMTDPRDFYTREDQWVIPADPNETGGAGTVLQEIQPFYVLMRLPDAPVEEYVLILPFNPRGRPNMVSYLVAKSGPEDYGRLIDFRFPKGRLIHGVGQVHSRINATEEISRTRSLLDQRGSTVVFGNLLVIPLANSILYVQPMFVEATGSPIPELTKVILATSERVVMGDTLEDALRLLVEGGPIVVPPVGEEAGPSTAAEAIAEALRHLEAANAALRSGDLSTYQREIKAAEDALRRAESPSPSGSPTPSP